LTSGGIELESVGRHRPNSPVLTVSVIPLGLQEGHESIDVLELDRDHADVLAILTDEALARLISHVGRDAGAVAVRADLDAHLSHLASDLNTEPTSQKHPNAE